MNYPAFQKYGIPYEIQFPEEVAGLENKFLELTRRLSFPPGPVVPGKVHRFRSIWTIDKVSEDVRHSQLLTLYEWIEARGKLGVQDMTSIHTKVLNKESAYRKVPIFSRDLNGSIRAEFPTPEAIPELLSDLADWETKHPLSMTSLFIIHLLIVCIHPFEDGNGRVARAIVHSGLKSMGIPLHEDWHPELIVHWSPEIYLGSLREACSTGFVDPFLRNMYNLYTQTAKAFIR